MDAWLQVTAAAAFLAGLAGGVHCAAMCGPLLAAIGATHGDDGARCRLRRALAYNAGRIASYTVAGALTGALGAAGLAVRGGPVVQQSLLAVAGIAMILMAAHIAGVRAIGRRVEAVGMVLWRRIEPWSRRFLPAGTPPRAFGLGIVWGWLPCGMVYVALIAAAATADPAQGALVMAAFGLGTLPNLLAIAVTLGYAAGLRSRTPVVRWILAGIVAAGGMAGLARAANPSVLAAGGEWCMRLPGLAAIIGAGG